MNKNKKLWMSIMLTTVITFPAGWALGNGAINRGLVNALGSVGENLFGEGNFGASIVNVDGTGTQAVQIDVASGGPPDDNIPVYLNVFVPPDPVVPDASCVASAQIAITSAGVRVIINPEVMPIGSGIIVESGTPLGVPPDPCRADNVIGEGPG